MGRVSSCESPLAHLDPHGRPVTRAVRALCESWLGRYPSDRRAKLDGEFRSKSARKRLSAWWELFLHETFWRAGYEVEVLDGTPDFVIHREGRRLGVEAVVRHEDDASVRERDLWWSLHAALDRACTGRWHLSLQYVRAATSQLAAGKLARRVHAWLSTLDPDGVRERGPQPDGNGLERFPTERFDQGGWVVEVEAFPTSIPQADASSNVVRGWGHAEMTLVANEVGISSKLHEKADALRASGFTGPSIVAVHVARGSAADHQIETALFGGLAACADTPSSPRSSEGHTTLRRLGSFWNSSFARDHVIGVLTSTMPTLFHAFQHPLSLWTNPHHRRAALDVEATLPWQHRWVDAHGAPQASALPDPASFYGVPSGWPWVPKVLAPVDDRRRDIEK